ncbi:poly(U)-specific endoribonuclease-B isoform X3 [Manihot esculenta]|uniref:EndoU domain-containing protein n=1 Tax=Manihot esculenta TaxID=3983 RepID=A0A2C9U5Q3_MANES|nr:poly(U)-specific endoribonuclease-B isoform X3 [Manihot esculenta]OAY24488.1 hypothetical protein MANES_17G019700v8 [Manihot esculenta]
MDGLIKNLRDVALGRDQKDDESSAESRDTRARSSWAQVVSGEQGNCDQASSDYSHGSRPTNQWREEELSEGINERRPSRRTPKDDYEGCERSERDKQHDYNQNQWDGKKGGEENNDGWETVGRKHPKRSHKIEKEHWNGYKRPPSEQVYSDEVENGEKLVPSDQELADLSQAFNRLWQLDINRLVPGRDYQIDCGEGKKVFEREDMAEGSLFSWLKEDVLRRPTFSRFCSLLDNYNPNEGCKEVVTYEEKQEQAAFIEEISRTAPIKYIHKLLAFKGIVSEDYHDFKRILTSLWFDLYGRGGTSGSSSAFEHVFVGEVKQRGEKEVSGFHNWLQPDSDTQLLTVQFEWNGILKSVSSILVGVSPEFEVALYTLCFYLGGEDNHMELGPYPVNIKCYRFGNRIGSVFPIAEC